MDHHAMNQAVDLVGFVTLGLLGGFGHCVGMCSPFALFVSRRYALPGGGRSAAALAQAWYNLGRIATYTVLGGIAGALGGGIQQVGGFIGVQRAALLLAGAVLVAWALASLLDVAVGQAFSKVGQASRLPGGPVGQASRLPGGPVGQASRLPRGTLFDRLVGVTRRRVPGHPLALGLFLGLLPCGFLYSAVVAAVARGGALQGALAMMAFGVGTAPALLGVSFADEILGARRRSLLNRLAQVFILAMGARLLWRGLTSPW